MLPNAKTLKLLTLAVGLLLPQATLASGEETAGVESSRSPLTEDAFLKGWEHYKRLTQENLVVALRYFEEALRLDPGDPKSHAALASAYWDIYQNNWSFDFGMPSILVESQANEHLEKALEGSVPLAHVLQSRIYAALGFPDEAIIEAQTAVEIDGKDPMALAGLAAALVKMDRAAEARSLIEEALDLDPDPPPSFLITLGAAQFGLEKYDEAAATFERAVLLYPDNELPLIYLASSYGHLGRIEEGDDAIEAVNIMRAGWGMGELSLERKSSDGFSPFKGEIDLNRIGVKECQSRLIVGLSRIPALTWHYRITMKKPVRGAVSYIVLYEVEGARNIDVRTAKTLHDKGASFIDVSNSAVWSEGHVPGALHLPYGRSNDPTKAVFQKQALQRFDPDTDEIVFYCYDLSGCPGAAYAAAKAVNWGYQHVHYFNGGAPAWREQGYPIEIGP